jgi:DNA repair protein RadA/Sms
MWSFVMAAKDKIKTRFVCSQCGTIAGKWCGQCSGCDAYNTMIEETVIPVAKGASTRQGYAGALTTKLALLDDVEVTDVDRISTGLVEFDRVLGGGLVVGGTAVLGGNPGAGKSTLLLQTGCHVARQYKVAYFTGEESLSQIKARKSRLGLPKDSLLIATETNVVTIAMALEDIRPDLVILDSIQTMYHPDIDSLPGNVSQVKGAASYLNQVAKTLGIAAIFVGHITKSESLAGPKALEHVVDCILHLSSTDDARYRMLRAEKNRFGTTSELGVFAMTGTGLKVVENPSAIFLSKSVEDAPGVVVTPLWEGTRPMLVEVQALVDQGAMGGNPRRVSVGLDDKRLAMLLAVLHKHVGLQIHDQDVYANVVGGVKVLETSADLPALLAVASSFKGKIIPRDLFAFGEVGLSGEVRPCQNGQDRIREAAKLGFKNAVVPAANYPKNGIEGMDIMPVATLAHAVEWLDTL